MGTAPKQQPQKLVKLCINPASLVDALGDPVFLKAGEVREFTTAEAKELLALVNSHGVPVCQHYNRES